MSPPSLRMSRTLLDALPALDLPEGFDWRAMRPGEEMVWASLLNGAGDLGEWTEARVAEETRETIPPEHILFVVREDTPVATACVMMHRKETGAEVELGWVAVRPESRGHRLGYWVCLAVLYRMRELGFRETYLWTDDHRLPAVKTYLNLGFVPQFCHEGHRARWESVMSGLKLPFGGLARASHIEL